MTWLLRSGYRILVDRCLPRVWQWLISLGLLYTGPLYYEESQVLAAMGQVRCFVGPGAVSHRRPAEVGVEELQGDASGCPGASDAN